MKQVNKPQRNTRTYKTTDGVYNDAMRRAGKEKKKLAQMVEQFVTLYASGAVSFKFFKMALPKQSPKTKKQ